MNSVVLHYRHIPMTVASQDALVAKLGKGNSPCLQASGEMDTDSCEKATPSSRADLSVGLLPEVEAYAYLLVVLFLMDRKAYDEVCSLPSDLPVLWIVHACCVCVRPDRSLLFSVFAP